MEPDAFFKIAGGIVLKDRRKKYSSNPRRNLGKAFELSKRQYLINVLKYTQQYLGCKVTYENYF